jgi:ABC-type branched-subunit amino acid transport system substrate-binding protein
MRFVASLLCIAVAGAPLASAAQGVSERTVVLGQSAPLSGSAQASGEEIRNGALAYLKVLNDAGGVHSRRIELATLDDAGEPSRALANTQRLVEQLRVFALLAYPESSVTREVLARAWAASPSSLADRRRPRAAPHRPSSPCAPAAPRNSSALSSTTPSSA